MTSSKQRLKPLKNWSDDLIGKVVIDARENSTDPLLFTIARRGYDVDGLETFWSTSGALVILSRVALFSGVK